MFALFLQNAGYQATVTHSAAEALDAAKATQFDLILSDIAMPVMNGYELAEALRSLKNYRKVPMVSVSGFDMYDDRERSREAGFNAHLSKPVNPQTFNRLIEKLLSST
jgi:two-component system cell cycle response regulator DivK